MFRVDERRVELRAADVDGLTGHVTVEMHDDEFHEETASDDLLGALCESSRGSFEVRLACLLDAGVEETYEAILDLPDDRISGDTSQIEELLSD